MTKGPQTQSSASQNQKSQDQKSTTSKPKVEKKPKKVVSHNLDPETIKKLQMKKETRVEKVSTPEESSEDEERDFFEDLSKILSLEQNKLSPALEKLEEESKDTLDMDAVLNATSILKQVSKNGVYVQAESIEQLITLLKSLIDEKIPFCGFTVDTIDDYDLRRAEKMFEAKHYDLAVILSLDFELEIPKEDLGNVTFLASETVSDLVSKYKHFCEDLTAVYPCILTVINKSDKLVTVKVEEGRVKIGTQLVAFEGEKLINIGRIMNYERIVNSPHIAIKLDESLETSETRLYSKLTRESIEVLKKKLGKDLTSEQISLIVNLKKILHIPDSK